MGVALYNPNSHDLQAMKDKWGARGWTEIVSEAKALELGVFERTARSVGDDQSCIIKLSSEGSRGDGKYRDTAVREASWMAGFNSNGHPFMFVT